MTVFELNNQFYLLKRSLYKTGILLDHFIFGI